MITNTARYEHRFVWAVTDVTLKQISLSTQGIIKINMKPYALESPHDSQIAAQLIENRLKILPV
jgi:hypothetical protein